MKKSGLDVCDFSVVLDAAENHDHDMAYLHGQGAQASTAMTMTGHAPITTMVTVPPVATTTAALRK